MASYSKASLKSQVLGEIMNSVTQVLSNMAAQMDRKGYTTVTATIRDGLWLQSESDACDFQVTITRTATGIITTVDGRETTPEAAASWILTAVRKGIKFQPIQTTEDAVLTHITTNPGQTNQEVAAALNLPYLPVASAITKLVASGALGLLDAYKVVRVDGQDITVRDRNRYEVAA